MNKYTLCLSLSAAMAFSACSAKLTSTVDATDEQIKTTYKVTKDVPYGADKEQTMDIYMSENASKLKNRNFTVVFLHGGGYYVSDKSKEERYIRPYLKKGLNVVNLNYRIKRGVPVCDGRFCPTL